MKHLLKALVVLGLMFSFGSPGWAKSDHAKGNHGRGNIRGNKGENRLHGRDRARAVQQMNTKAAENRGFQVAPGLAKEKAPKTPEAPATDDTTTTPPVDTTTTGAAQAN